MDLSLTSDNELILFHGWDSDTQDELELDDVDLGENGVPDLETFKNMKICKKYTTMTGEDLVSFMKKNPSIYILTDEKFSKMCIRDRDTVVSLKFDKEKLYKNMVDAKADWLYELPQWDEIFDKEKKHEMCIRDSCRSVVPGR